jgi:penicillin-binding protein 1A
MPPSLLNRLQTRWHDLMTARPLFRRIAVVLGLGLAVGTLAIAVAAAVMFPQLPSLDAITRYEPVQPLRVLTADGIEIAGFGTERRIVQRIDQIPRLMKDSLLAVEDARFYEHHGIDPIGIARAMVSVMTAGTLRRTQGGSTITQQVARTFFLTRERTVTRKLKEALLAFKIESELSKDQVLELYMNQIYLGSRSYGFEAASRTYFGKTLSALSAAECAMLAGLPQNPHNVNPIRNPERARARQLLVLGRMKAQGVIDAAQYDAAKAEKLHIRKLGEVEVHAEHVAEMVRQQVFAQFGDQTYSKGINVTTTLLAAEQQAAYKALRRTLIEHELRQTWRGPESQEDLPAGLDDTDPAITQALNDVDDDEDLRAAIVTQASPKAVRLVLASGEAIQLDQAGLRQAQPGLAHNAPAALRLRRGSVVRVVQQQGKNWWLTQWPAAEGALVALDPALGEVRALVGGFDFKRNQFNHVTQGKRQPGSSYKPFVYAAAMEHGVMPETLVNDAPMTNVGDWNPANSDGSTDGPISVRTALTRSKNLVTIRLVQLLGATAARDWTARFGFDAAQQPDNLTLALGTGATTPLQMASAYGVLANGGHLLPAVLIRKITGASGETLFEAPKVSLSDDNRVVSQRNTFLTASLLQDVTRIGTAARAQATLKRTDLYGKTGTTNDVVDAWFAGFQPSRVAVVWIGHDTPQSLGNHASGGSLALPAWIDYMAQALKGVPVADLTAPDGVVRGDATDWRYTEWAAGGFLRSLGVEEGQVIGPALIPKPPDAPAVHTPEVGAQTGTATGAPTPQAASSAPALPVAPPGSFR